jgi:hypothetical protein
MRTQEEIAARFAAKQKDSFFGFDLEVLVDSLDYEHAKPHLKPEVKPEEWTPSLTDEAVKKAALEYLEFAWGKVEDHRGISAGRSVQKMAEYCWLLGMDDLVGRIEREEVSYAQYGAPIMKAVSEALGFPVPVTPSLVRMMAGDSCRPSCEDGCGS